MIKRIHGLFAFVRILGIFCLGSLMTSCGGGGILAEGGIGGSGISQGPVSAYGSVFVNGIEHFLDTSSIQVNGQAAVDTDLKLGMVVRIVGSVDSAMGTGVATDVSYEQNLEGPIDAVDVPNSTLVVLGQTVQVDGLTVFDGVSGLSALTSGVVVEISGLIDGTLVIHATRVDTETDTGSYELSGTISNHNAAAKTFDIGSQTVDYSGTLVLDVPGGVPANGLFIRVEGARPGGTGTPLVVGSVVAEDNTPNATIGEDLEIDGYISNFVSALQFTVAGQPVRTSASTQYEHGVVSDLGDGVRIEVEGSVANDGVLDANEVSFKGATSVRGASGEIEFSADIESVDVLAETITVFGSIIMLNASTQFEDERDQLQPFGITDLVVGDRVEVSAFFDGSGDLIAESLHRKIAETDVQLEGQPQSVDPILETVTVFGVQITTDLLTVYRDEFGAVILPAAFFAAAQTPNASIDAKGTLVGQTIQADELEL